MPRAPHAPVRCRALVCALALAALAALTSGCSDPGSSLIPPADAADVGASDAAQDALPQDASSDAPAPDAGD